QGTYRPAGPGGNRQTSFVLADGVALRGGFAGIGAPDPDARDPELYATTLSGDLNGDDATVGNGENSHHVVDASGADASAALSGFTITGGNANNGLQNWNRGAGILVITGGPTIERCVLVDNRADWAGAGLYVRDAAPVVVNCRFLGNFSQVGGGAGAHDLRGGTHYVHCEFSGNVTASFNGGGGLQVDQNPATTVISCTFTNNEDTGNNRGGGINVTGGANITIASTILWGNTDTAGSGESSQIDVTSGAVTINHSCVQGLTGALGGVGNTGVDPMLFDADGGDNVAGTADDDLRLTVFSPSVDSGDDASLTGCDTDVRGLPRVQDGDGDLVFVSDHGANEFCLGDLDGSGDVGFGDILAIIAAWGPCPGCPQDLNGNGFVDFADILVVIGAWGPC
ncbi:MAG: right-handed parallel beta-helix repeat-containing protein, partial [Planctomycetota bacterium]